MASGATLAPQMEQPDPPIDGSSGDAPPKPTNSQSEVGSCCVVNPTRVPYSSLVYSPHQTYGRRRLALEGVAHRVIRWPQTIAQTPSITGPMVGSDQKEGCP